MVNYRRFKIPGGSYFFTVTLRDRASIILTKYIDILRDAIHHVKKYRPFKIDTLVVLPDHLHAIWTLPPDDDNYSIRWNQIKGRFTQIVKRQENFKKDNRNEYNLWQRRFWEHVIKDDLDMENHVNYIHYNPVKHGLAKRVKDWPYSTFHQYVREMKLPSDWGDSQKIYDGKFMD
jgi:putative transposase